MNCILSRATEQLPILVSLSAHKGGDLALFHLFRVTSGLFQVVFGFPGSPQPALTCQNLLQVAPFVTNDDLQNILSCIFTKNELYVRYCYKVRGKCYYEMGSFLFYKTGQVVLQSRVGIREWHNFYYKMGGGSIPKWGNHYKEEQGSTKGFWQLGLSVPLASHTNVQFKSYLSIQDY